MYMTEFLQSMPAGQKICCDKEIGELFEVYARLVGHLEAFFSILCKERFHLNDSDVDKAMMHSDAIDNLWRYLNMSVIPKLHILFVHLLRFMELLQGFGELLEDDGEQAHQEEVINESRVSAVLNLAKRSVQNHSSKQ